MDALQRVASMIAGPDARADYQFTIPYGQANEGIEVFSVCGGWEYVDERRRRFIKKKTIKKAEFQFVKLACLLQDEFAKKYEIPAPAFLHVERIDGAFYIFQEFVEGTHAYPVWSKNVALNVAHSIYRLNIGLDLLFFDHRVVPSKVVPFGDGLYRKISSVSQAETVQNINRMAQDIEIKILNHAQVICHNDVYWSNFAFNNNPSGQNINIKFIDFGMIGQNYVGADLHHFAVDSIYHEKRKSFFEFLVRSYAKISGFPEEIIAASAFYYAAHRQAMRFIKTEKKEEAFERLCALLMSAQVALGAAPARRRLPRAGG